MSRKPPLPIDVGEYLAGTGHLTTAEHGAPLLTALAVWRAGGSIPYDRVRFARTARMTPARWDRAWEAIGAILTQHDGLVSLPTSLGGAA